ncbi:TMEM68 [Branchiostoma lanceolatum]|uniref:TMEM68 protein n=1 Tax=Branchiostoma lanceolatum TaxID=7740 RepID=A0A8J9ZI50_BRALA|nr:TMEM68 [Branchiostoma lanceolatum]
MTVYPPAGVATRHNSSDGFQVGCTCDSTSDTPPAGVDVRQISGDNVQVECKCESTSWPYRDWHARVRQSQVPNFRGARIPVPSSLNIAAWRSLLEGYHDADLCDLLEFGFPVNYESSQLPVVPHTNHPSALQYPSHVERYIRTELAHGATIGPLPREFFGTPLVCNPLQTVPKKGTADRRIVVVQLGTLQSWNLMLKVMCVTPGAPEDCIKLLQEGNLLSLSPGGVREALFGDEYYRLVWRNRMGFAKVAKKAKVPIYPMFTQNCREGFRSIRMGRHFLEWVYEKTRLPIVPIYGGFPVKFRTYIGDPIPYDPKVSAQELAVKTHNALEQMIDAHQKIPGTVFGALLDRIPVFSTEKQE